MVGVGSQPTLVRREGQFTVKSTFGILCKAPALAGQARQERVPLPARGNGQAMARAAAGGLGTVRAALGRLARKACDL